MMMMMIVLMLMLMLMTMITQDYDDDALGGSTLPQNPKSYLAAINWSPVNSAPKS